MGKHRTPYPAEFRAQIVELVKAGRRPEELEKEFEPTAQTIYNWVAQADRKRLASAVRDVSRACGTLSVTR
ncbi:transposase [Paraburkholderia sp. 40]|uniref:transposase n=1 Tax=Paraburkholderia sp. 40 TaxID=2991059 RepID=UPI003D1B7408